ncbi:hypothetical protein SAMN05421505_1525 [Sinosporangium album]|uniref:Sirohydrochlorin ferrochelatase n=1 Tax=Sinosporangium album TaxID=504805 RepID=A0A1G8KKV6_9ACTN|nr:hypothetical protein [Sinosporangium album]SDI44002.1 hypothetical protein SAMN05421505_1525 [Sinosporangium album]
MPAQLPPEAPALVLVTAGEPTDVADDLASLIRTDNPQIEVRLIGLDGDPGVLTAEIEELGTVRPEGAMAAIVVTVAVGPEPRLDRLIAEAVKGCTAAAVVAEPLGPHPLLAEALHLRLAEAGLARADRVRLLSVSSPVDAVIVVAAGGPEAMRAVETTSVLLASRLTLPVMAACLDRDDSVAEAAERLRAIGAERIALSPCVIGPDADQLIAEAAEAIGARHARPIGAHTLLADLAARAYGSILAEE